MQFGAVRSTSQVANSFIGTGRLLGFVVFRSAIVRPVGPGGTSALKPLVLRCTTPSIAPLEPKRIPPQSAAHYWYWSHIRALAHACPRARELVLAYRPTLQRSSRAPVHRSAICPPFAQPLFRFDGKSFNCLLFFLSFLTLSLFLKVSWVIERQASLRSKGLFLFLSFFSLTSITSIVLGAKQSDSCQTEMLSNWTSLPTTRYAFYERCRGWGAEFLIVRQWFEDWKRMTMGDKTPVISLVLPVVLRPILAKVW